MEKEAITGELIDWNILQDETLSSEDIFNIQNPPKKEGEDLLESNITPINSRKDYIARCEKVNSEFVRQPFKKQDIYTIGPTFSIIDVPRSESSNSKKMLDDEQIKNMFNIVNERIVKIKEIRNKK